jgi:alkaline phosphatase D
MPIGLVIGDGVDANGQPRFENMANGDGPPLGRELELAALLAATKRAGVRNVVWLTADVHYAAAHHYAPERARFKDFDPFWEFVAGPLNAGSFGPAQLDDTFGPKVVFHKPPPAPNTSPFAGFQFFGQVDIAAGSGVLTVQLKDIDGRTVHTEVLSPDTSRA